MTTVQPREFRIFEKDKYDSRWFVCSRPTLELAKSYIARVFGNAPESYIILDENGVQY